MASFGLAWNSSWPSHCALLTSASVPSGRAVESGNCAEPYRPMPLPATNFALASSFFAKRATLALAPAPPPVRQSLNAPTADGFKEPSIEHGTTVGVAGVGKLPTVVPTTAQGLMLD